MMIIAPATPIIMPSMVRKDLPLRESKLRMVIFIVEKKFIPVLVLLLKLPVGGGQSALGDFFVSYYHAVLDMYYSFGVVGGIHLVRYQDNSVPFVIQPLQN